ncbi:MAG: DNA mismatch repair protein MutS [Kiritimatiellae bacterium]|nr:DNA mismatch repair protein MutS [Kiritimatiellia bacterium]
MVQNPRTAMSEQLTPMMAQYRRLRASLPSDSILFFRLGDFYEMFFDDAKEAAGLLDITLTRRQSVPMCGVPYHAAEYYIGRLLRAGRKVAICDQMEDASKARGLVTREITRMVTPGSAMEESVLESPASNFLCAMLARNGRVGVAGLELSTGEFWVEDAGSADAAAEIIARWAPAEILIPDPSEEGALPPVPAGAAVSRIEDWRFLADAARETLTRHFEVLSLEGFALDSAPLGVCAAGAALDYVARDLRRDVRHIRRITAHSAGGFLALDEATVSNLELVPQRAGASEATLWRVLDVTRTPMGARRMRDWLLRPLAEAAPIRMRHEAVDRLVRDTALRDRLRETLGELRDLERMVARLSAGSGNARDLRGVGGALQYLPEIQSQAASAGDPRLSALAAAIATLPDLRETIERAVVDEPPATIREGGMIRAGCHPELDALREAATQGRDWIARFQASEQQRTGIKSLKVRHNKIFGYYIEITRAQLAAVPPEYVRKQTMANAERFITDELKQYENRILGAQERAIALEGELFQELRARVAEHTAALQTTASALAELDALAALADRAAHLGYVKPRIADHTALMIREGRHPVVEALPGADRFVPNDTRLDTDAHQVIILTGPNMAGKSTYIRQVALIVIMAQMGSFVPAAEAEIGVVDRVFTRVGAGDDLARGRSTFLVEMQETARILNSATPRSLVVLDEIGRGTSTFDGISIAWAVAEYLHHEPSVKAKTLFATHYHELSDLALTLPGVKNFNVLVRERGDRVVFLRKVAPGAADKSYGIQVARLAGLPPAVLDRAREILENLEEGELGEAGQPKLARRRPRRSGASAAGDDGRQLTLF